MTDETLKYSPLDARHRALGAKMTPFGGWDMPLQYGSVLDEHRACRTDAVVFDVSHLGTVRVAGPAAFDALQATLTNDLRRIAPGRAQYTHLLDPVDAHVVDDIIVWWVADHEFLVMPNASNTESVVAALIDAAGDRDLEAADVTETRCVLALQGPKARSLAASIAPDFAAVDRFAVQRIEVRGVEYVVAGTGYTGEDGLEVQAPAAAAERLWDAAIEAGFVPAGLGARDTLRLEAGLPLHGHDLGPGITPLQAGLGWVVGWDKDDFRGRAALSAERERGVARRLVGLTIEGRQPPRADSAVLAGDQVVGHVSSGNFSPALGYGIALAFVDTTVLGADPAPELAIDIRGKRVPARRSGLPFLARA